MEAKTNTNEKEKALGHEKILSINFNQDQGPFKNLAFFIFGKISKWIKLI